VLPKKREKPKVKGAKSEKNFVNQKGREVQTKKKKINGLWVWGGGCVFGLGLLVYFFFVAVFLFVVFVFFFVYWCGLISLGSTPQKKERPGH